MSNIVLFGVLLFFLSVSLDIRHLPGHLDPLVSLDLPVYSLLISSYHDNYLLDGLHLIFLVVWVMNFFIVRELFHLVSNRLIGSIVFLLIFPVLILNGRIDPVAFDVFGSSLLMFSMLALKLKAMYRYIIALVALSVWCGLGTSYFFMIPFMLIWILRSDRGVSRFAIPFIAALLPLVFGLLFGVKPIEMMVPDSFQLMAVTSKLVQFDMMSFVAVVLAVIWTFYVLVRVLNKSDLNAWSWLGFAAALMVFVTANYYFFSVLATIVFLMNTGVIRDFFLGRKVVFGLSYLIIPLVLAGYFDLQERNQWMKLGLKDEYRDVAKLANRIDLPVNIYNNEQSIEELAFFFPEANLFIQESEPSDSIVDIFEMNSVDIMHWINFRMNNDIKAIYFNFDLERDRHLMFLGSRLGDGEWALIHNDEEERALLVRREDQFNEIIQRFSVDPSLQ